MEKCIIAAIGENRELGAGGQLLWHLSEDLKFFKRTTMGCPIIMGSTTYLSLPFRPLKGRKNIVVTRRGNPFPEAFCVDSIDAAFAAAEADADTPETTSALRAPSHHCEASLLAVPPLMCPRVDTVSTGVSASASAAKCFVIGGAQIYKAAIDLADRLYITQVHGTFPEADVFFPEINSDIWALDSVSEIFKDEETGLTYEFLIYIRR